MSGKRVKRFAARVLSPEKAAAFEAQKKADNQREKDGKYDPSNSTRFIKGNDPAPVNAMMASGPKPGDIVGGVAVGTVRANQGGAGAVEWDGKSWSATTKPVTPQKNNLASMVATPVEYAPGATTSTALTSNPTGAKYGLQVMSQDPEYQAWAKEVERLRAAGVDYEYLPAAPGKTTVEQALTKPADTFDTWLSDMGVSSGPTVSGQPTITPSKTGNPVADMAWQGDPMSAPAVPASAVAPRDQLSGAPVGVTKPQPSAVNDALAAGAAGLVLGGPALGQAITTVAGTGATGAGAVGAAAGNTAAGAAGNAVGGAAGGAVGNAVGGAVGNAVGGAVGAATKNFWEDPTLWAQFLAAAGSAGASLYSGNEMAKAAEKAAQLQKEAADKALALQESQFNTQQNNIKPWLDYGKGALVELDAFDSTNPNFQWKGAEDPSYDFRFKEGMKALEASASAKGMLQSGNTLKAITDYGQGAASQEFNNAFNRYNTERGMKLNRLQSLAGIGQTAVGQANNASQGYANNAGNALIGGAQAQAQGTTGAADARASGWMGAANAGVNSLTSILNNYNQNNWMNALMARMK